MLNQIMVGSVLTVEVRIKAAEEIRAKMYSHHHCFPKRSPGKIIQILVPNAQASITFTRFQ